ncbi:MAG: hypothetical protein ACPGXX_16440, partial [Planctomycetaceae bacterium]
TLITERRRHQPEQIAKQLQEGTTGLATGRSLTELVQTMEAGHPSRSEHAGGGHMPAVYCWSQCPTACSGVIADCSDRWSVNLLQRS